MSVFGKDPASRIRRAKLFASIKNHVGTASNFAQAALRITKDSTLKDYLSVGTLTLNAILKDQNFDPETSSDFAKLPFEDMVDLLSQVCDANPDSERIRVKDNLFVISHIEDQTFIAKNPNAGSGGAVYYKKKPGEEGQVKKLQTLMGRKIWESYSSKIRVYSANFQGVTFKPWTPTGEYCSDQTKEVYDNIQRYLKKGYGRSIMLYGPPGTGKSCMTQYIANKLGWHTLYIDATSIFHLSSKSLGSILRLLRPEMLVIDDMDRVFNTGALLSAIDAAREYVKVFLVTINDKGSLDAAVKRAGRFDEIVLVKRILEPVSLFPDFSEERLKRIDEYPVAFLDELHRRIDVYGEEIVDTVLDEFDIRVRENRVKIKKDLKELLGPAEE